MATRWFIFLSVILAFADWMTKHLARVGLQQHVPHEVIPDFLRITLNFNEGIAWGMLPEWSEYLTYFAIIMVLVILMILRRLDRDEVWLKIALSFQMAGAMGNMYDRLKFHRVTDFIDVTLWPHTRWEYDWPIFNLADSFVVVGTVVLVLVLMLVHDRQRQDLEAVRAARISGDLSTFSDRRSGEWESIERLPGSVPIEEALVEIPKEAESEMLEQFERENGVRREVLEEPLGSTEDELKQITGENEQGEDVRKLREFPEGPKPGG